MLCEIAATVRSSHHHHHRHNGDSHTTSHTHPKKDVRSSWGDVRDAVNEAIDLAIGAFDYLIGDDGGGGSDD